MLVMRLNVNGVFVEINRWSVQSLSKSVYNSTYGTEQILHVDPIIAIILMNKKLYYGKTCLIFPFDLY